VLNRTFLRLGVACAVYDDDGRVLLSRRGDLDVWNLPTGRLDRHEPVDEAAAREAHEETGVHPGIDQPVGLYFLQATNRLNILFSGYPIGGQVADQTDEASANAYFWLSSMPQKVFGANMAHDALEPQAPVLHTLTTPPVEIRRIKRKLAWRWVQNLLRGQPEPRHVRFYIASVGVIYDENHKRVLTVTGEGERPALPRIRCRGRLAPWTELRVELVRYLNIDVNLRWVGLWQHTGRDQLEFVFAATVQPANGLPVTAKHGAEWSTAQNIALVGRDAVYVQRVTPEYNQGRVWLLRAEDSIPRRLG
jgi:8-oxo-dGTP diphosphatase